LNRISQRFAGNYIKNILWLLLAFAVAPWIFCVSSQKVEYEFALIGFHQGRFGRFLDIVSAILTFCGASLQWYLIDKYIFLLPDIHWSFIIPTVAVCVYAFYSWATGLSYFIRSDIRLIKGS